jgi:hypothetical protein
MQTNASGWIIDNLSNKPTSVTHSAQSGFTGNAAKRMACALHVELISLPVPEKHGME